MTATFTEPRFTNEDAARQHLESIRWPNGPVCPHCGGTQRNNKLNGTAHRKGVYACGDCRTQFTVTVGTVFERSKIPLHTWVLATHLLCSSKKGMSSKQLERTLNVTYKTAWFMSHRIREAMKPKDSGLLGGTGGTVEADETFIGNKPGRKAKGWQKAHLSVTHLSLFALLVLVDFERGAGGVFNIVRSTLSSKLTPLLPDWAFKVTGADDLLFCFLNSISSVLSKVSRILVDGTQTPIFIPTFIS